MSHLEGKSMRALLSSLVQDIPGAEIVGDPSLAVTSIVEDSREALPGSLFVARPGAHQDGARFISDAVARGAIAVMSATRVSVPPGVTLVLVGDPCMALAQVASRWHGDPSRSMRLIGITGTDGKTSVTYLIAGMLAASGPPCLYLGTLGAWCAGNHRATAHTTPPPLELHATLAWARTYGANAAAMEASSHSLDQGRLGGLRFSVGVFTVLGRDHLDYHGTIKAYLDAKLKLFAQLEPHGIAVVNSDQPQVMEAVRGCSVPVMSFSPTGREADVAVVRFSSDTTGTKIALRHRGESAVVHSRLLGLFQVENLAAAAATGIAFGMRLPQIAEGLQSIHSIPGRFEPITHDGTAWAVVDYAHTPGALERAIQSIRAIANGRVIVVFGCGGDRDRGKRPLMGSIASRLADVVILTSDNPRTEDPMGIIEEIRCGVNGNAEIMIECDRREAIKRAAAQYVPGDMILVAGKGHEQTQVIGTEIRPFSDAAELRTLRSRVEG